MNLRFTRGMKIILSFPELIGESNFFVLDSLFKPENDKKCFYLSKSRLGYPKSPCPEILLLVLQCDSSAAI